MKEREIGRLDEKKEQSVEGNKRRKKKLRKNGRMD